jgi:hypothetical protein
MAMPLDEDGGGDTGGGLTGWDMPHAGQSSYNTSGNWGLGNTFSGPWGNTFNSEVNVMNPTDPMVISNSMSAMAPKPNSDSTVVEAANAVEVEKVREIPTVCDATVDAGVDVVTASKVSNGTDGPVATILNVQEKRARKPAVRGEIIPLTTKDPIVNLPDWFSLARTYLEDGLDVEEWRDCVETWVNMENALGLSEVGSVRLLVI